MGERPPLNPPSDGPGPAGYEGMEEIHVTREGDVYLGDERATGVHFPKEERATPMDGGEGSNKLYLPRTTHDGGVFVGDLQSQGVKMSQEIRGGPYGDVVGDGAGKLYLLPDPFRYSV